MVFLKSQSREGRPKNAPRFTIGAVTEAPKVKFTKGIISKAPPPAPIVEMMYAEVPKPTINKISKYSLCMISEKLPRLFLTKLAVHFVFIHRNYSHFYRIDSGTQLFNYQFLHISFFVGHKVNTRLNI